MSKVSICIPTYNNLEQVVQLLHSIEEQTYQNVEVIITDDSQNEEIAEWIQNNKAAFRCLQECQYQHNEQPLGHIFNWNEALKKATGTYIKIMFSDDWFTYPNSLEKMVNMLENNPQVGLVYSGTMQVSKEKSYARCGSEEFFKRFEEDYRYLFIDYQIGAPSAALYRACDCYFDERSTFASDVFLFMRILKKNPHALCIQEPLISIGIHEQQYTCDFAKLDERKFRDYEILFQEYDMAEKQEYREWFLTKYVIPYKKGGSYAKKVGIPYQEYLWQQWKVLWWKLTVGYPHGVKKRLGLLKEE